MKSKTNNQHQLLVPNPACKSASQNLTLFRIIHSHEVTQMDFGYQVDPKYIRGGWAKIYSETFLRIKNAKKKYKLLNVIGIPMNPLKQRFKTKRDYLTFSLYFEPIPADTPYFDMIENEKSDENSFNFYNVAFMASKNIEQVLS